jgi:hypothetical protein
MANLVPIVIDLATQRFTELPQTDDLDLSGSNIAAVQNIFVTENIAVTGNVDAGNVNAGYLYGDGRHLTNVGAAATVSGANTEVQFNDEMTLGTDAAFTFDKTTGRLSVTQFAGDGSRLTSLRGAQVNGTVSDAITANYAWFSNLASFANTATGIDTDIADVVITGGTNNQVLTTDGAGRITWETVSVSGMVGNIADLDLDGNVSNVLAGDGTWVALPAGNIGAINLSGNGSQVLAGNGTWVASEGNANFANFAGEANISNVAYSVALANVVGAGNIASINKNGNVSEWLRGDGTWQYIGFPDGNIANTNYNGDDTTYLNGKGEWANIVMPTVPVVGNVAVANFSGVSGQYLSGRGTWDTITVPVVGNIAGLNTNGLSNAWLRGDGTWANISVPVVGNVAVKNFDGNTQHYLRGDGQWGKVSATLDANANVAFTAANVSLGDVSNLHITGGSNGQVLTTDGNGVLSFATASGGGGLGGSWDAVANIAVGDLVYGSYIDADVAPGATVVTNGTQTNQPASITESHYLPFEGKVSVGNNMFVMVNNGNKAAYSTDCITWTQTTMPSSGDWLKPVYANGKWVALMDQSTDAAYSTDGITWTQTTMPSSGGWRTPVYGVNMFVAYKLYSSTIAYSTDGITWTQVDTPSQFINIIYGNNVFVGCPRGSSQAIYSTDGINWTSSDTGAQTGNYPGNYINSKFIAIAKGGNTMIHSTDGINWQTATIPFSADSTIIEYGQNKYLILDSNQYGLYSTTDLINFTKVYSPQSDTRYTTVKYINGWWYFTTLFGTNSNATSFYLTTMDFISYKVIKFDRPISSSDANIQLFNNKIIQFTSGARLGSETVQSVTMLDLLNNDIVIKNIDGTKYTAPHATYRLLGGPSTPGGAALWTRTA